MRYTILRIETWWTTPFFLASWLVCGAWYALKAGRDMARLDTEEKKTLLDELAKQQQSLQSNDDRATTQ